MLRTLGEKEKSNWKEHLPLLVHAYNCTRHEATGFSPHYLMFGRHPCLPVDLMFGLSVNNPPETPQGYAKKWALRMKEAYQLAGENSKHSSERGKKYYDRRIKGVVLQPGDRVLVCNMSERGGPGKLRSYWEKTVYVVKEQVNNNPIYKVLPEQGNGKSRVLHRNLLHVVNDLPADLPDQQKSTSPAKGKHKQKSHHVQEQKKREMPQSNESESSDSETPRVQYWLRIPPQPEPQTQNVRPTCDQEQPQSTSSETRQEQQTYEMDEELQPENSEKLAEQEYHQTVQDEGQVMLKDETVRKSARDRRPPQVLTYESLGQPSYQPHGQMNVAGLYAVHALPGWSMQKYPLQHYNTYQTLPYTVIMPYTYSY